MYDEETRERALGMLAEGLSPREVSRRMGGSPGPTCVSNWRRGRVPGAAGRRPAVRLSSQEKLAAVRRVLAGEHYRAVAEDVGCAPATLLGWRRAHSERGEAGLVTEEEARRRVEMRSADGLPDDPAELKAMVIELQFQADLARELLEIVKKRPRRRPGGALPQGADAAGEAPEAGVFTDLLDAQAGLAGLDLPLPEREDR